jgi:hypothetical protein
MWRSKIDQQLVAGIYVIGCRASLCGSSTFVVAEIWTHTHKYVRVKAQDRWNLIVIIHAKGTKITVDNNNNTWFTVYIFYTYCEG